MLREAALRRHLFVLQRGQIDRATSLQQHEAARIGKPKPQHTACHADADGSQRDTVL